MATLAYIVKSKRWTGSGKDLAISSTEVLENFLHGIPICTEDGRELSRSAINQKILAAQDTIEETLSVKLWPTIYDERRDFVFDEFRSWGYTQVTFQVKDVCELKGFLGSVNQIDYPIEWVSRQIADDEKRLYRTIHLVPSGAAADLSVTSVIGVGITPHAGFLGFQSVPNYWNIKYRTGFNDIPADILEAMGKLASIGILNVLGDILLGAGIASRSLAFDGLSESVTTTQSAENSAYSARIRQYEKELKKDLISLRNFYRGIRHITI